MNRGRCALAALVLLLPAAVVAEKIPKRLLAMTPEAFDSAIILRDDVLERDIVVSTEKGFGPARHSPIRHLLTDYHLRALIDRESGTTRYEVHQLIRSWGAHRDFVGVNYQAGGTVRQKPLLRAVHAGEYCANEDDFGVCSVTRRIVFELSEAEMRAIASSYAPGKAQPWDYRIKEADGADWQGSIVPAEAAGLLRAADRFRARRG